METTNQNDLGSIHISDKAISSIAARTAALVPHVHALDATLAESAARRLGRGSLSQGAVTRISGNTAEITLRLIVESGYRIPDIALKVQKAVKDAVERDTGCQVDAVHILVAGIVFPEDKEAGQ